MNTRTILASIAAALVLTGCAPTVSHAEPTPPEAIIAAEPGPACGTVHMGYMTGTEPHEIYRVITKEPTLGTDVALGDWQRQAREPSSRIDTVIPSGYSVTYKLWIAGGLEYFSDPVVTSECPDPTAPTPSVEPVPSSSASSSASPSASSSATPSPGTTGSPAAPTAAPEPEHQGGLANTGSTPSMNTAWGVGIALAAIAIVAFIVVRARRR